MEIKNPHDKFFKETFSDKNNVKDLLINSLPSEISCKIDLDSIVLSNKSFVDEELRESFSDLLIQAMLSERDCLIYILVEHKSYPDKFALFQLLKYMVKIWDHELKHGESHVMLMPIIPVLFYHGKSSWNYSNSFISYFPQEEFLKDYIPAFKSIIYDLSKTDENAMKGNLAYIVSIMAMKHIFSDLKIHFKEILDYIDKNTLISKKGFFSRFLRVFLYYIVEASDTIDYEYIENSIYTINNERLREDYMTVAQQLRKEGREEGIKIGLEKGIEKGIEKGREEGREEGLLLGRLNTAKNLYKLGMDLKKIQKATNLPLKEIRKIIKG